MRIYPRELAPNLKKEGWSIDKLAAEAVNEAADEMTRKTLRGSSTNSSDGDRRDVAGGVEPRDTPEGRERAKNRNPVRR